MEKHYNHQETQAQINQLWNKLKTYSPARNPGPLYSIDTPPPTVSGSLHIGHIFSYTQTDILARFQRMNGYSVFYPFGFDDNGLPTERYVEQKLKMSAHTMSRSEFIALCLKETHDVEEIFKSLWQRMGLSVDWDACYSTISDRTRTISQESFIRLYQKGYIYRKLEPALYCTSCYTSVAQAELDDTEKPSHFNDIVFTGSKGEKLVIGTTRPELLPSCVALFYHPDDARYQHLKGTTARVPLFDFEVPVFADPLVNPEKGTGLVMCCTFGDKNDIHWVKTHNLPYKESIDIGGRWKEHTGFLVGLKAHAARALVIEKLKEAGLLVGQREILHAVNVHERCKKEIEYLALSQWFLKILDFKKELLAAADEINWYPHYMKSRYQNWVENLGWDWGLSRQRFYGIPFPVWHCNDCHQILLPAIADLPVDPQEHGFKGGTCTQCGSSNISPDTDVMDTWNTSSITPYICADLYAGGTSSPFEADVTKEFFPMSMRPQAHDIIRTWAFYTITKSWMHNGSIPWKDIVISGHVLSDNKEKLSKSKGNASLAPEQLLETYPADVIRYWTASGNLGHDISFSESQLKIGQRLATKLWNAFRFLHEHLTDKVEQPRNLGMINEWILHQSSVAAQRYKKEFEVHEFHHALSAVETFFWNDFCDNYLELIKDQLFHPEAYTPEEIQATKWTMQTVGVYILQMFAPFMPYITESLYQLIFAARTDVDSLHRLRFSPEMYTHDYAASAEGMKTLAMIVDEVRKLKTAAQLSLKTDLNQLSLIGFEKDTHQVIKDHEQLIKGILRAKSVVISDKVQIASELIPQNLEWDAVVVYQKKSE